MGVFRFLDLPGEVRNQVYGLLLTARYQPGERGTYCRREKPELTAGISASVATPLRGMLVLLYSLNIFQAHPTLLNCFPFLTEIGRPIMSTTNTALIRRYYIEVRLDVGPRWTEEDLKKAFNGVQVLHVVSWQASFGQCGLENLLPFAAIRGVGKATVEGSAVSPGFARWLEDMMQRPETDSEARGKSYTTLLESMGPQSIAEREASLPSITRLIILCLMVLAAVQLGALQWRATVRVACRVLKSSCTYCHWQFFWKLPA